MKKTVFMLLVLLPGLCFPAWVDRNDPGDYTNIIDIGLGMWHKDIYVYQGQTNTLYFQRSNGGLVQGRIRINNGDWSDWVSDYNTFEFNTAGNFTNPGEYTLELDFFMEDGNRYTPTFTVHCVPARYEFYYDDNGNFLSHWKGGDNATDRPILIVEGFDPTNENSPAKYFDAASNFMSELLSRDTDIFILDFDEGGADMTTNAQIVTSAINYIESIRSGNQQIVLCGVSMGGVIARYAAVAAEQDGQPFDISHFLSIDSPQRYALLDANFQDYVNGHDGGNPNPSLNSPAAKQLLEYNT
ncbi:MAG: hypothetical protein MAGBODY4_00998 [Candidatus Marinimicrobia bacterium]|nr:hypothetical protein [Candidatus Neomarinimicrobiota bacterium]